MSIVGLAIGGALGAGAAGAGMLGGLTALGGGLLGATVGSQIGGSMNQASAAKYAANVQAQQAAEQMQLQREMFDIQRKDFAPYRSVGYQGVNLLRQFLPGQYQTYDAEGNVTGTQQGSGFLTENFTPADIVKYGDPAYDFMLKQGLGAVSQRYAPGGGGSNRDIARTMFAQNYAKTGLQQAFENKQTMQTNLLNRLQSIVGIGTGAQTQVANLAQNTAGNISQLGMAGAAARAGGAVGAANAYASGVNNLANLGMGIYGIYKG